MVAARGEVRHTRMFLTDVEGKEAVSPSYALVVHVKCILAGCSVLHRDAHTDTAFIPSNRSVT